jgi:hypothetical protein
MNLRVELSEHTEELWVIGITGEYAKKPLSPLTSMIDWFQNFFITNCILSEKLSLQFGEKLLMKANGLLPAKRLLIIGLGAADKLDSTHCKKFMKSLDFTLHQLNEKNPWLVVSSELPDSFCDELIKSKATSEYLTKSALSIG